MALELYNEMVDFCRVVSDQSKGVTESDMVYTYYDSSHAVYAYAKPFKFLDRLTFKDVVDEDYQYEYRDKYLDTELLKVTDEDVEVHNGLEYIFFYYLIYKFEKPIRNFLSILSREEENGNHSIFMENNCYEVDNDIYNNYLYPLIDKSVEDFRFIHYLFEHVSNFIYRASGYVIVDKNNIELVLTYINKLTFEKLEEVLNREFR